MAYADHSSPRFGLGDALLAPLRAVVMTIESIRDCNRLGNEFDQLSHKSNARLAADGLTREELPAALAKRYGIL
ncbi:hypothetical protein [Marinibacterium profundimaris]|uniref:DUF1127 domain-containing protein n=1 Tax=Marinibacterium profundimaris TaxID=1679460 RepID=A0A225NMU0_9RHOB|nr:hypothetical protein [Marinibacterium profundimaris]OWU75609.1 hypothetical protein ATO3_05130 [Marinibacterium profundimaris]